MEFLNTAVGQVRELFASMTAGARVTAGLLLAVLVVSLVYLFAYQTSGGESLLLNGHPFSAGEATAAEAALAKAGLADWSWEGSRIRIPKGRRDAYVAALAEGGALPEDMDTDFLGQAAEQLSAFAPQSERDRVHKIAEQKRLASVIREMRGIENAVVSFDSYETSGLKKERVATASVSVRPDAGYQLDDEQVQAIRHLLSHSIAPLSAKNVAVIDLASNRAWSGAGEDGISGAMDDAYLQRKRAYESDYKRKVHDQVAYIPGVIVGVDVELDPSLMKESERVEIDPKSGATVHTEEMTESIASEGTSPGGIPGLRTQQPNQGARIATTSKSSSNTEDKTSRTEQTIFPHNSQRTRTLGLTPTSVSASIRVPEDYLIEVWHKNHPAEEGEEATEPDTAALAEVERSVFDGITKAVTEVLLKEPDAAAVAPKVTVTRFEAIAGEEIPEPAMTERAFVWLGEYWTTLAMIGLGVFCLLILRSMLRGLPAAPQTGGPTPGSVDDVLRPATHEDEWESDEGSNGAYVVGRRNTRPSLRDDLLNVVREDPEAAATILKGWIGSSK